MKSNIDSYFLKTSENKTSQIRREWKKKKMFENKKGLRQNRTEKKPLIWTTEFINWYCKICDIDYAVRVILLSSRVPYNIELIIADLKQRFRSQKSIIKSVSNVPHKIRYQYVLFQIFVLFHISWRLKVEAKRSFI